jgi:hypothetical protein
MQHSGFFNAIQNGDGTYDRTYSANDYCDNLATVIRNGVRYSSDNDLAVTAGVGMAITVGIGRAWINGHYYFNDAVYTNLVIPTAPTGSQSRIDLVVLRLDQSTSGRNVSLMVIEGTPSLSPTMPAYLRNDTYYDLVLAKVTVEAGITTITSSMITDTRSDGTLCGWASSVTPAIMSMLRQYVWNTTLSSTTYNVTFDIPQYDPEDVHILDVYTNGILELKNVDYTLNGSTITFTNSKAGGTEITVVLYKSIDGTGLESIADQFEELQDQVSRLTAMDEYIYECNGSTDNIAISEIATDFIAAGSDNATLKITVVGGNIGITAAQSGSGTSSNHYVWFRVGASQHSNRRVIIDFSNAGQITIPTAANNTYNDVFYGTDAHIIGANLYYNTTNSYTPYEVRIFTSDSSGVVQAEDCTFRVYAAHSAYISTGGTFTNCHALIGVQGSNRGNACCFAGGYNEYILVRGGSYRAYISNKPVGSTGYSAVASNSLSNAVIIMDGVNCPTMGTSGMSQDCIAIGTVSGGVTQLISCISTLPTVGSYVTKSNHISKSLPSVAIL